MFFASYDDEADSYDAALASAMQAPATAPQPRSMGSVKPITPEHAAPIQQSTTINKSREDAPSTRTFVSSSDVLAQRRAVKSSPTPPARRAPTKHLATLTKPRSEHQDVQVSSQFMSTSLASDLSTVSDTGTALSLGDAPYKVPNNNRPTSVSGSAEGVPYNRFEQPTQDVPQHRGHQAERGASPSISQGAIIDAIPAAAARRAASPPRSIAVITRWVQTLKRKAKWRSPFATTVRGQILEAQGMLRDVNFNAIPPSSLRTQIDVWLGQLSQYMASQQSTAKLHYLFSGAQDRRTSQPQQQRQHVPDVRDDSAQGVEPTQGAPRRPLKILRRGDGLRRTGVDKISAARSPLRAPSAEVRPDVVDQPHQAPHQALHATKNATSSSSSAPGGAIPVQSPASRATARNIAAYLEQLGGVASSSNTGRIPSSTISRVVVSQAVRLQRRQDMLDTFFQSPDITSPDVSRTSVVMSAVPRLDIRQHKDVFSLDESEATERSFFLQFRRRPRQLEELIAATLAVQ